MVRINEILKTIQGELRGIGFPIILLRFSGCNLSCSWCDAYEASHQEITKINNPDIVLEKIEEQKGNISSILITGGEPFLYLNEENKKFFRKISQMFFNVIIETNGFIPDNPKVYEPEHLKSLFPDSVVRVDCSPKINLDAYRKYDIKSIEDIYEVYDRTIPIIMKNQNYIIKMVYKPEYEEEILKLRQRYNIPHYNFCVLPYTPVIKNNENILNDDKFSFLQQFRESCRRTVEFCLNNDIIFSPREHIFLYTNDKGEYESIV